MEWIEKLRRRVSVLLNRSRIEREMDEEMRIHLEMEIEELQGRGLSPKAALVPNATRLSMLPLKAFRAGQAAR